MNFYHTIIRQMNQGALYLLTIITGPEAGQKMTWQNGRHCYEEPQLESFWKEAQKQLELTAVPYRFTVEGREIFAERLVEEPELVICGGGHVSLELAALADYLEYSYTVIDDRPEFAGRDRFPRARECICMPFAEALINCSYSANAYYIIVTRGHLHDLECLDLILQKSYGYVGMIGSRAKVRKAMDELLGRGHSQEVLDQVHAPIGLPIGGQSPKEIAVSIIGEIIQHKHQEAPSSYLDYDLRAALERDPPMVLARIIDKRGSAPRGIGSWMLVDADGIAAGTVGGGTIEYEAAKWAAVLLRGAGSEEGPAVRTYRLNHDTAASLGMWCGGEVDVFFERLK